MAAGSKTYVLADGQRIANPRQIRTLLALWGGPIGREAMDRIAGSSNSPDVIARLRRKGFDLPCEPIRVTDRDGKVSRPGVYLLTASDRIKVEPCIELFRLAVKG